MALSVKVKPTKSRSTFGRDPTIYDYANNSKSSNRPSKISSKITLAEIELETEPLGDDPEQNDGRSGKSCLAVQDSTPPVVTYNDYHIDLWFLVSEFIRPEDVCRFALICRKTAEVVQSGRFWTQLYRSYYDRSIEMPARFQPASMVRLRGLRSAVIRSLYYLYPPFVERLTMVSSRHQYRVIGRQLLTSWHKRTKNCWTYCFRLKTSFKPGSRPAQSAQLQREKSSLAFMQDIYMNPEEGCQILMITTDFLKVIPLYNETLFVKNVVQTLSQSMMRYKISIELANYCGKRVDELVFDPVRNVTVLDWWKPDYYTEIGSPLEEESSAAETEWTDDSDWDN
ncbi:transmembrane protein 183 [Anopheles maculipalpis]|uniref:transmembrane protein 183 n=1 Tax=Anopheles maculipalpis TaxID=1496333 RepID=UPI002158C0FD|nr:transmembrane protein 183 [Anopheles maculipalpis]